MHSRVKYAARLRSVAGRLLNVACAMLKTDTTFNPALTVQCSNRNKLRVGAM
jgi:hypothetical protein